MSEFSERMMAKWECSLRNDPESKNFIHWDIYERPYVSYPHYRETLHRALNAEARLADKEGI